MHQQLVERAEVNASKGVRPPYFAYDFVISEAGKLTTGAPFDDRVGIVAEMAQRGYADRMVLSQDAACFIDWIDPTVQTMFLPNWHYLHIEQDVLPALRDRGVTDEQIDQMLVANPRRYFENVERY